MTAPAPPAPYRRARDGRLVAGVAAGLAEHLRVPVPFVRIGFAVLATVGGFGVLAYLAFWALVPRVPVGGPARRAGIRAQAQAVALAVLAAVGFLLVHGIGFGSGGIALPVVVAAGGLALIWRQAEDDTATATSRFLPVPGSGRIAVLRVVAGGILVVGGGALFLVTSGQLRAAGNGAVGTVVVVAGLALITGPWWWRLVADLRRERFARAVSQERAEVAAHLHDSVLQTLALIQRSADDPREVARLARGQERELRSWLFRRAPSAPEESLRPALEQAAAEVEDAYAVTVETVVVGDVGLDTRLVALVQAAREALVNAAKHAGVTEVALYAEVAVTTEVTGDTDPGEVAVYVRDRGAGFDPAAVPDDRHGLAGSVVGRMDRHGGSARIHTAPGDGTEVELRMPLVAAPTPAAEPGPAAPSRSRLRRPARSGADR